jgi:hypothetical protein
LFQKYLAPLGEHDREIAISTLKVGIPSAIGISCAGIRYAFEYGYCNQFRIPSRIVSIEIADIVIGTIAFALILIFLIWSFNEFASFAFAGLSSTLHKRLRPFYILILPALLWAFSSDYLDEVFTEIIFCTMTGSLAAIIFRKDDPLSRRSRIWLAVCISLILSACLFATLFNTRSIVESVILSAVPSAFALVIYFLQRFFREPELPMATAASSDSEDSNSMTSQKLSKSDSLLTPVIAFTFFVAFLAGCTYGVGRYAAKTRVYFSQPESMPDYVILATYGDLHCLRQIRKIEDTYTLQDNFRIITNTDLGSTPLKNIKCGPLSFRKLK